MMTTRLLILCGFALTLFLTPASGTRVAHADEWPMQNLPMTGQLSAGDRFVYVPKGHRWRNTVLSAKIVSNDPGRVTVSIDGKAVAGANFSTNDSVRIALPDMKPGFHRLNLTVNLPDMELRANAPRHNLAPRDRCEQTTSTVGELHDITLSYRNDFVGPLRLADFPDTLYNPHKPRTAPLIGAVDLGDAPESDAASAALRLASVLGAPQAVQLVDARMDVAKDAAFKVRFRHDPKMEIGARLSLHRPDRKLEIYVPTLDVHYRDPAQATIAVHALLNTTYRGQLIRASAPLQNRVPTPIWATGRDPQTLADLGLTDVRITGSGAQDMIAVYPSYWLPNGVVTGRFLLRGQDGLQKGSAIQVWSSEDLSGSVRLDTLSNGNIERAMAVHGALIPQKPVVGIRLVAQQVTSDECLPHAKATIDVDVDRSTLILPHSIKSGLPSMGLALTGRPIIKLMPSPGALTLAYALMAPVHEVTGGGPLPFVAIYEDAQEAESADATLHVNVDKNTFDSDLETYRDIVHLPTIGDAIWLKMVDNRYSVSARTDIASLHAAKIWPDLNYEALDGTISAIYTDYDEILQLERKTTPQVGVNQSYSNLLPWILAAIALIAIAAIFAFRSSGQRALQSLSKK